MKLPKIKGFASAMKQVKASAARTEKYTVMLTMEEKGDLVTIKNVARSHGWRDEQIDAQIANGVRQHIAQMLEYFAQAKMKPKEEELPQWTGNGSAGKLQD